MASQAPEQRLVIITYERYPRRWFSQQQAMVYAGFEKTSRAAFLNWADKVNLSVVAFEGSKPKYDKLEIDAAMEARKIKIGGIGE